VQEDTEPINPTQPTDRQSKPILSVDDEQKLARYVDLLAKIAERRKKEQEDSATTTASIRNKYCAS
jgi:hypothetical protein